MSMTLTLTDVHDLDLDDVYDPNLDDVYDPGLDELYDLHLDDVYDLDLDDVYDLTLMMGSTTALRAARYSASPRGVLLADHAMFTVVPRPGPLPSMISSKPWVAYS